MGAIRKRTLTRWTPPLVAGGLVVASLAAVVRRGEEGRRLSQELDRLEAEESILNDRLAAQTARADSLGALPRIERAAGAIGLRRAGDGEVFHVADGSGR